MTTLDACLKLMKDRHASDLFLTTGAPPSLKIDGVVHAVNSPKLQVGEVQAMAESMMNDAQKSVFATTLECNFSWSRKEVGRYRINVYHQRGEVAMVMRMIDSHIPDFEALGLPPKVADLAMLTQGLVLVTGAAGSGKTTTLASMIRHRSVTAPGHILTIEDPIEYLFPHAKCLVDQREVGVDTLTFAEALRSGMREAPDVIMIGEIRDMETAQHAISYAETGHLCVSTLHANNTSQAIERMYNFFPEESHNRVLQDLSMTLKGVIGQRLIPGISQQRVLAVEIFLQTPYLSDLLQRGRLGSLKDEMAKGNEQGMVTFDQSLFELFKAGKITEQQAIDHADSATNLRLKMRLSEHHTTADAPSLTMHPLPNTRL